MTEEQEAALTKLMAVECKIDEEGCGGPWCKARAGVADAFGIKMPEPEPAEEEDPS